MSNTKPVVAITYKIPSAGIRLVEKHFEVRINDSKTPLTRNQLLDYLSHSDGAITLLFDKIDRELIEASPKLKVIANHAVGYENVDCEAAAEKGIWVTNTPDVLTDATADLAFSLLLAVTRRIIEADDFMRRGFYRGWNPLLLRGIGITGKTIGIVGFGRIGKAVARRAQAFGMKIIFADPGIAPDAGKEFDAERVEFDELLSRSDIVTLHCPYSQELHHMINAETLDKMKESTVFINTARGKLMDEEALYHALLEGRIAGAGLDVYENEPDFVFGLNSLKNVIMLPHIGSATYETRDEMATLAAGNVIAVLRGRKPMTPVNNPRK